MSLVDAFDCFDFLLVLDFDCLLVGVVLLLVAVGSVSSLVILARLSGDCGLSLESFFDRLGVDPGEPAGKSMVVLESPSSCLVSSEKVTDFLRCMGWFSEPAEVSGSCGEPFVVLVSLELCICAGLSKLK